MPTDVEPERPSPPGDPTLAAEPADEPTTDGDPSPDDQADTDGAGSPDGRPGSDDPADAVRAFRPYRPAGPTGSTGSDRPRSFKLRRGRVTPGQRAALETLWPRYGIDLGPTTTLEGPALFGRQAPLVLEIGFGMGETTVALARAEPDRDVIAVDVHTPGAGSLLRELDREGLTNVRVAVTDALGLARTRIAPGSLDEIRVFFPDPWPKSRHHKRRLLSPEVVHLLAERLQPGGRLHVATDWAAYAEEVLAIVAREPLLVNRHGGYAPRPPWRPLTRFERQGLEQGRTVHDIIASRVSTLD